MIKVKLEDIPPNDIMDIVNELKELGWKQGVDFDWSYNKPLFDSEWNLSRPKNTVFTFYNEKYGTWFALKYG